MFEIDPIDVILKNDVVHCDYYYFPDVDYDQQLMMLEEMMNLLNYYQLQLLMMYWNLMEVNHLHQVLLLYNYHYYYLDFLFLKTKRFLY